MRKWKGNILWPACDSAPVITPNPPSKFWQEYKYSMAFCKKKTFVKWKVRELHFMQNMTVLRYNNGGRKKSKK